VPFFNPQSEIRNPKSFQSAIRNPKWMNPKSEMGLAIRG